MVIVYFETPNNSYAELAAIFPNEEIYMACLEGLEKIAKENRFIITESCENSSEEVIEVLTKH